LRERKRMREREGGRERERCVEGEGGRERERDVHAHTEHTDTHGH
jgi:hypothetical protein